MKRENGYYWVKYGRSWEVATYKDGSWWLCGKDYYFQDDDFKEINEIRIINPMSKRVITEEEKERVILLWNKGKYSVRVIGEKSGVGLYRATNIINKYLLDNFKNKNK